MRIAFRPMGCAPASMVADHLRRNASASRAAPKVRTHPVAVAGGGHSLLSGLEELCVWPGDVWAINSTADFLLDQGIDCIAVSIDPNPFKTTAAQKLLASGCAPQDNAAYWDMSDHVAGGVPGGVTTASRCPSLALRLGYPGAMFFGCEGSFPLGQKTHVNKDDGLDTLMVIAAGGDEYVTHPELFMQCETLSEVLREFPKFFQERSGGLLRAMTHDTDWSVAAVSTALRNHMAQENGVDVWTESYQIRNSGAMQCPIG